MMDIEKNMDSSYLDLMFYHFRFQINMKKILILIFYFFLNPHNPCKNWNAIVHFIKR